ncbi:AI-2E family transporter [Saccharobesus litoralis]|uniref:AI-2E family transporter n=1 Tax=Saccharobesus litoralis TaxID=2172099 RepID=A0A2S0VLW8_9ALTE|nr:AI-2E family transporter [Saccharobesus litoralis]AWB65189.1 AI-2E family transporter [Saccharobesus litoralis]
MLETLSNWYNKRFSDPDAIALALILLVGAAAIYFLGGILTPVLVSLVIAYLLEWPVNRLVACGVRRIFAVGFVLFVFVWICSAILFGLSPLIWQQAANLLSEVPTIVSRVQVYLLELQQQYPNLISTEQASTFIDDITKQMMQGGKTLVSMSFSSLFNLVAILIYLVLVPLMIFFMLKDKEELIRGCLRFMPNQRRLAIKVWLEMDLQIGKYIQGKVIEIVVVGLASVIAFALLDLRYAILLGVAVGLSVLIPYIGAAVVTIPVAAVALFQFGVSAEFWYVMIAYGIIQAIDGNVIVPILFSQAVNLNPVVIIIAVLFFGGLWGFWGVFFAIPLAALVKAVINAWPASSQPKLDEGV